MGYYLTIHGYKDGSRIVSELIGKLWGYQDDDQDMLSMHYLLSTPDFKEFIDDSLKEDFTRDEYTPYELVHDIYWGSPYCISGEFEIDIVEFYHFSFYYLYDYNKVFGGDSKWIIDQFINIVRKKPDKIGLEWG